MDRETHWTLGNQYGRSWNSTNFHTIASDAISIGTNNCQSAIEVVVQARAAM
jgi:hypothetical protein